MAIRNATRRLGGASLIEFMIAALVGAMALGIVGSVFISSQRSAAQRSQEILLLQNMTNVLQVMKEDLYQAGYGGVQRKSVLLSGATRIVHTEAAPPLLGYVYQVMSGASSAYLNVVYRQESTALKFCEKRRVVPLTPASAADSIGSGLCYSLFDPRQISVTAFSARTDTLVSDRVSGAVTTVSLTAALTQNPSVSQSLSFHIQQRNWQ
ncbi:PilW family protein [Vibrio sp. CJQ_6]|uniref:PilW family protein n=1 Tax=Vibrio sp. CJQ_6 TaxID=3367165 RepID=UPI00370C0F4B